MGLTILHQPDDSTCGPTSLHSVYRYFGLDLSLDQVISGVKPWGRGGNIAVNLALHAQKQGFHAVIYSYNLRMFDPIWSMLTMEELQGKLKLQQRAKRNQRLTEATFSYLDFLSAGGKILFRELTPGLLHHFLSHQIPLLTGLSATYLYRCAREITLPNGTSAFSDIKGLPMGHFVVLHHWNGDGTIAVADPYKENPLAGDHYYDAPVSRIIASILLGILTYDANLLVISPDPIVLPEERECEN